MSVTKNLEPLPLEQWPSSLRNVIEDMQGSPLNVHALLANNTTLLQAWWPMRNYCVTGGSLGQRSTELVILRTGALLGSWYEWASHIVRGLACGLSQDEIERVATGPAAPGWSPSDAALLSAVDELFATRAISDETRHALEAHFSHEQVLDLVAVHSMYLMLGTLMNLWPVPLDEHVAAELPEGVLERFQRSRGRLTS